MIRFASTYNSYFLHAQKYRRLIKEDFDKVFAVANPLNSESAQPEEPTHGRKVDILLTPAAVGTAPILEDVRARRNPVEEYVNDVMTIPASLAGEPLSSLWQLSFYFMHRLTF